MAREAGMPRTGTLRSDRSIKQSVIWNRAELIEKCLLRAKTPVRTNPSRSSRKPTQNWLPLFTAGKKGLVAAACQTSCSEESIG
jgi:hypothetical protein